MSKQANTLTAQELRRALDYVATSDTQPEIGQYL